MVNRIDRLAMKDGPPAGRGPVRAIPRTGKAPGPQGLRRRFRPLACALALTITGAVSLPSGAGTFRLGYVDLDYLVWRSDLARASQERLARERHDAELALRSGTSRPGCPEPSLACAAAARRTMQADLEKRQIDELGKLADAAIAAVRQIAEAEGLDLVVHDAVFAGPQHDITLRVLTRMRDAVAHGHVTR